MAALTGRSVLIRVQHFDVQIVPDSLVRLKLDLTQLFLCDSIALLSLTKDVLEACTDVLGFSAPERM